MARLVLRLAAREQQLEEETALRHRWEALVQKQEGVIRRQETALAVKQRAVTRLEQSFSKFGMS